jgi:acetyl esterase/lipase
MKAIIYLTLLLASVNLAQSSSAAEPKTIPLWKNGAPGEPKTKPEDEPTLYLTKPDPSKATPTAMIVIPGGGYGHLAMDHEGKQIADWLNSLGITAFVLKYRMSATGHRHPVPMMDGQRAIRTVRSRAIEWNIDPNRIGIIGFSAGGHLSSTLGTHFQNSNPDLSPPRPRGGAGGGENQDYAPDEIDHVSPRPDFMILCYPVISFTDEAIVHKGSRKNLLGENPDKSLVESLSNQTQVTKDTPPTFLFHTNEDSGVLPENSILFYNALRKAGVPAELHLYEKGPHGVGLARDIEGTNTWPDRARDWLKSHGWLDPK